MNWSRVKNIMIFILVLINAFLITVLSYSNLRARRVDPSVINAAAVLLSSRGFECDASLFPSYLPRAETLSAEFDTPNELARKFFGDSSTAFWSSSDTLIAQKGSATLSIENHVFSYSTGKSAAVCESSAAKRALKDAGFDLSGAKCDDARGERLRFYRVISGMELDGAYIDVSLDEGGALALAEGFWPSRFSVVENVIAASPTEKAVEFDQKLETPAKIEKIEPVYGLGGVQGNRVGVFPKWRVTTDLGSAVF